MNTHYRTVREVCGDHTDLCIVTKHRSAAEILSYYDAGERNFGENRINELKEKAAVLPGDIRWHYIGHLQKNKVRDVVKLAAMIQSVDSPELARLIEKECAKQDKTIQILAEFHMAEEDTNKTGMDPAEAESFFTECLQMPHVDLCGIMVMGPHTEDRERITEVFRAAHDLFVRLQEQFGSRRIRILSMGMSDDYTIAVGCGSTMVRIGTYLFE